MWGERVGAEEEETHEMSHEDQLELELEDKWEGEEVHSRRRIPHVLIVVRW